jgi:TolB protein
MRLTSALVLSFALAAGVLAGGASNQATPPAGQTSQPASGQDTVYKGEITGEPGAAPRYAVPDFLALSKDPEVAAAAKTIAEVLWDDLAFEREFYMIPRDTYSTIPAARSVMDVPFDRWRELGADGLIIGSVERTATGLRVEVRLFNVRGGGTPVFGREYAGNAANPRFFAHTISDEIHQQQRALPGVARTKLTFSSDRDRERLKGTIENREVKEVYIADYDGANQRRVTTDRTLNITPTWAPDGRAIAFTSYRRGFPDVLVSMIYQGRLERPTAGRAQNWLPAWSPDGSKIAFTSNRDGNPELYVMNRDGSNVRRVTQHPAIDTTPTWSPTGTQIAFTSDRTGSPAIYVVGEDGLNLRRITTGGYCDRATWSPAPYNELAYVCKQGPGYDIFLYNFANTSAVPITHGEGSNESPSFSPTGRHLAFTSTRAGKTHVFTVGRDGNGLRQVTKVGNNFTPDWSN